MAFKYGIRWGQMVGPGTHFVTVAGSFSVDDIVENIFAFVEKQSLNKQNTKSSKGWTENARESEVCVGVTWKH